MCKLLPRCWRWSPLSSTLWCPLATGAVMALAFCLRRIAPPQWCGRRTALCRLKGSYRWRTHPKAPPRSSIKKISSVISQYDSVKVTQTHPFHGSGVEWSHYLIVVRRIQRDQRHFCGRASHVVVQIHHAASHMLANIRLQQLIPRTYISW